MKPKLLRSERGSATVWMLALVPMLSGTTFFALGVAQLAIARSNAAAAADMAALAAASHPDDACGWAARIAMQNASTLAHCSESGPDVFVRVFAPAPPLFAAFGVKEVSAEALAGPEYGLE